MFRALKKSAAKSAVTVILIALAVIAAVVIYQGKSLFDFVKGPKPIEAGMDYDGLEGSYVSFDAVQVLDEFVRQTSRESGSKKEKLENIGYLVYFEDDGWLFGMEMKKSKEEAMNAQIDETIKWMNGDLDQMTRVTHVTGTWKALTGKRLQFFKETVTDDLGEEYLNMAQPYYIDTNAVGDKLKSQIYIGLAIIGIALLCAIYTLISFLTGSYKRKIKKYIAAHPEVNEERLEADYAGAAAVGKRIRAGRRYTVFTKGIHGYIVDNQYIVWAYYYQRTGRYQESSLHLYDKDGKLTVISASEKEARHVMDIYQREQSHIVLGYSKELEQVFVKNRQDFLNLRYNYTQEERERMDARRQENSAWNYTNQEQAEDAQTPEVPQALEGEKMQEGIQASEEMQDRP